MPYQVPVSSYPLLQDPPFALLLFLLGAAIGYRTLRILRVPLAEVAAFERGILAAALGLGLLQFFPFVLGVAGRLTPGCIRLGLSVLLIVFAADMARVCRAAWRTLRGRRIDADNRWIVIGLLMLLVPLMPAFFRALSPCTDVDGVSYHLTIPKRWLQHGAMDYVPSYPFSVWPMGVEMLYTIPMAIWSDTAAKLIHFGFGLLTLGALFALGRQLRSNAVGLLAVFLFFVGLPTPAFVEFGWAYVDLAVTCQLVCAAMAWLLWSRSLAKGWLACAALCAGIAAAFKLQSAPTGVIMAAMTLLTLRQYRTDFRSALRTASGFFGIALLPLLPWLIRSFLLTGSPVYTFLPNVFHTRDWDPKATAALDIYFKYYGWANTHTNWDLAHRKLIRLVCLLGIAGGSVLLYRKWRDAEMRSLILLTGALTFIGVWTAGPYVRYLLPVTALICTIFCAGVGKALTSARWVRLPVLLLIVLCSLLEFKPPPAGPTVDPTAREAVALATGRLTREDFLHARLPISRLWDYANATLPADARIILYGGGGAYYSDRMCLMTDPLLQCRVRADTYAHFVEDLRRNRVGYMLLFETDAPDMGDPTDFSQHMDYPAMRNAMPFARKTAHAYGTLLFLSGRDHLYRLALPEQAAFASTQNPPE